MEIPRHWRLRQQRYRLIGEECPHCETKIFPPRDICPECGQDTLGLRTIAIIKLPETFVSALPTENILSHHP